MKLKLEQLPCDQFLQCFEIFRAFLPAVSHGEKRGKLQNAVKIAQIFTFPLVRNENVEAFTVPFIKKPYLRPMCYTVTLMFWDKVFGYFPDMWRTW